MPMKHWQPLKSQRCKKSKPGVDGEKDKVNAAKEEEKPEEKNDEEVPAAEEPSGEESASDEDDEEALAAEEPSGEESASDEEMADDASDEGSEDASEDGEEGDEDDSSDSHDETPKAKEDKMINSDGEEGDEDYNLDFHNEAPKPKADKTSGDENPGSKTVFVGNLSYDVTEENIMDLFKDVGEVVEVCLSQDQDGLFKGFDHVEFADEEAAQKVRDVVNNDVVITENTSNNNQSDEEEENEDSSSKENDSSSSDLDSNSSSDDDESSSSSIDEKVNDEIEEGEITGGNDEEFIFASDGEEAVEPKEPIKSKHEIEDYPTVPLITASLEPHHETLPVGVVSSIMGNKVIVEGSTKHSPIAEGSILWITETRLPLGIVDEIFGPVKNPYYIVRYNSESEVPKGVESGIPVSFAADFADHILDDKSLYQKGYDASDANDEEMDVDIEFSDDEKEMEYKRSLRLSKREKNHKEESTNKLGSHKKKNYTKGLGQFGKFGASQPAISTIGESAHVTSSHPTFPYQQSNSTPNHGIPPQQLTNALPQGFPPQRLTNAPPQGCPPQHMGMPGGGLPMMQNWMPNQQQNQNFNNYGNGMMQHQQHQLLTSALLGLIGQAGLGSMPFGYGPVNPAFNQGGLGHGPFGPMNSNPNGQAPFVPMNPNGQAPFLPMNPNGQMANQNGFGQVPFGSMPMNANPNGQVSLGPMNASPNGQAPFVPMKPNGQMANQNGFGQVPFWSVPNQGEMRGPASMQFNSGRSISSSGSGSGNNGNNRGRGRSFGRGGGSGRNSFRPRGGSQHNG